jgi:hypothetical protein
MAVIEGSTRPPRNIGVSTMRRAGSQSIADLPTGVHRGVRACRGGAYTTGKSPNGRHACSEGVIFLASGLRTAGAFSFPTHFICSMACYHLESLRG